MRRSALDLLEDDFDDTPELTASQLGFPVDLARAGRQRDGDGDDDLGIRMLYEQPEVIGRPSHWPDAA